MKSKLALLKFFLLFCISPVVSQNQDPTPADITINRDGILLKGKFYQAEGEGVFPTVILLQGSPGNTNDVLGLGRSLSRSGINAMTFNYSGSHQSTGTFSFPNCQADIGATFRFLRSPDVIGKFRIDTAAIILAGYSFGGGMATAYAIRHKEIKDVISIAGVDWGVFFDQYRSDPEVKRKLDYSIDNSIAAGIFRFEPGYLPKDIGSGQRELDPSFYTARNAASLAEKDLLIICGLKDANITMKEYILPLYNGLQDVKAKSVQLSPFEDDHTFSLSREKISQTICNWVKRRAVLTHASSQIQSEKNDLNNYPPVTIPGTETRSFYSKILEQEMVLYIKIPASYKTNTQKIYPCWYFTDANRSFTLIADMANFFEVPVIIEPEIFVVGIGYKIRDMAEWGAWRTRDLTPTNVPSSDKYWAGIFSKIAGRQIEVKTGGSAKFLECIEKEVFPFIESNYRVSSTGRGLGGYSYGGLFSLYVLFKQPELFSLYYAGSPSIKYDKGILYTYEKEYAATHNDLNATLFMTAGGAEDSLLIVNVDNMATQLESRNYPGLKVETYVFPDETHQSCIPAAVMRAFRVLYKKQIDAL